MTDTESMFWILTALTVGFSFLWVRTGGMLFVSQVGERPRQRSAGQGLLRNEHGGLLFGNLTPLGSAVVVSPWPLVISPDGILNNSLSEFASGDYAAQTTRFKLFEEIGEIRTEGRTLLIGNRPFVTCQSASLAKWWSQWLPVLCKQSVVERDRSIRNKLSQSFDANAAQRTMKIGRRRTRMLRFTSLMLLLYCFSIFGVILLAGLQVSLFKALVIYGWLVVNNWLVFLSVAAKLCGKGSEKGSWMLLVSPADAFHAADKLLRIRMERFHPAAMSQSLATAQADDPLVRQFKLELLHTPNGNQIGLESRQATTLNWHLECVKNIVSRKFGGLEVGTPEREETATHYCQRCENQFIRDGECTTCRLPLRQFSTP